MVMEVVGESESGWVFLQRGEAYLLDVYCSQGFASYSFVIQLNHVEVRCFLDKGMQYVGDLARQIQFEAPGFGRTNSAYEGRDESSRYRAEVAEAMAIYRRS